MRDSSRILVTGANGQVGHELLRVLRGGAQDPNPHPALTRHPLPEGEGNSLNPSPSGKGGARANARAARGVRVQDREIIPATRTGTLENGKPCEPMDLADLDALAKTLDRIAPNIIINAAAYTAVDRAEDETGLAQRINGEALRVLGEWAVRHAARVVHYSTDYVFDGRAQRAYREDDATHPVSAYGRSKLAGETALRASGARHLIFRTAWVYAARGHNFLRTMLRVGAERDALRVVDDQIGAPTPARLIADVTSRVLAQWLADETAARDGLYHLVAAGQTSWCGFARAIFGRARAAGLIGHAPAVQPIRTDEYPTRATRPAWSVLDTGKLREAFDIALPDWQAALDGVTEELANARS